MAQCIASITDLVTHLRAKGQSDSIFLDPNHAEYESETQTWGAQRNLKPQLVLRPQDITGVQEIVKALYRSPLDFTVRNGGVGSASSEDVVISLSKMRKVSFDREKEVVGVQGGALWADVDQYMMAHANGWTVIGARTPFVGVAGIVVVGGLSWLSHEFGLISDPQNLLDAQVVLGDGSVVWTSKHEDLSWALRGGRNACGVMTELKFRARQLQTEGILAGQIIFPMDQLQQVSAGLASHVANNTDPKVACHAFILNHQSPLFDSEERVGLEIFDGHGEEHGRSESGFKWAYDIPGAVDGTSVMSLYQWNDATSMMNTLAMHDACGLVEEIDGELLVRAVSWFRKVLDTDPRLRAGSYCLVEITQKPAFSYNGSRDETAFPHRDHKHCLQLGTGHAPEHTDLEPVAIKLLNEAFATIPNRPLPKADFSPTFIEPGVVNLREVYGAKYSRLIETSQRYDPGQRFRSILHPGRNWE